MLRTATARLVVSAPRARAAVRPLSTTAPAFIRIKKADGAAPSQPSPAEKPAAVPKDIPNPAPIETQVNRPAAQPSSTSSSEPAASAADAAVPPSEPPAPPAAEEAVPETPDLSKLPSLDIDPEATAQAAAAIEQPKEEPSKKKGGARKRPEYVSSQDERRRTMARLGYASLLVGGLAGLWYVGNQDNGKGAAGEKDERSFIEKLTSNFSELSDYFSKPAFKLLLPDPLPPPHQRPYTLLVDLEDMLVHSSWDRTYGWRTAKRPGVDYFLGYLSQFYEIVLFTDQPFYTAATVAEKLDPMTLYLPYKLFRDATRYVDGKVVKDLSYLNRDLSKVILLDTKSDNAALQPDNAVIIKPWDGKSGDKGLIEMIPFLESIGIYAPADVRPVLKNYAGKDIPTEYAKVEAAAKEAAIREWEARNPNASSGGSFLSGLFGGGSSTRPKTPMTYLEIKRAQAQRMYEEEQKYYKEHAADFMKMIEEDKARQQAEAKASMMDMFGGRPPAPAPEEQPKTA